LNNKNYSQEQVKQVIGQSGVTKEAYDKEVEARNARFTSLGLSIESNAYVGQDVYPMVEWYMLWEGQMYYLFFDLKSHTWVRAELIEDVFKSKLNPFSSWATHEDPFNFWSKAPADDIRPVAEAMQIIFNQALDNRQKRNFGQRAYDPSIFPDPKQLEWRPDGLVMAETSLGQKAIGSGIYEFQTPEVQGTIELFSFMDGFVGQKTGITPAAQGTADKDAKVGVYYGDLQQVADRLGLYNRSYSECWAELGLRYFWGVKEHLHEPMAVKMIGLSGTEWDQISSFDFKGVDELDITISGGQSEMQLNEVKSKKRMDILAGLTANPALAARLNQAWLIEQYLRNGEYTEDEISRAMDLQNDGNEEIISEAAKENQDLYNGKPVKPNRGATPAHIQKHLDFAFDTDLDDQKFAAVIAHAESEIPMATENMARKARSVIGTMGAGMMQPGQEAPMEPQGMESQIPAGTQSGTASMSGQLSSINTPAMPTVA
jgi:hypothetical protein